MKKVFQRKPIIARCHLSNRKEGVAYGSFITEGDGEMTCSSNIYSIFYAHFQASENKQTRLPRLSVWKGY